MIYRFASLDWFYLIPLLLVAAVVFHLLGKMRRKKFKEALGAKAYGFLSSSLSLKKLYLKFLFCLLGLTCMILALARPQSGQQKKEVKSLGVELIFMVDVSRSMLAEDTKPSRLSLAKKELIRFLDLSGGNKVGLIAFAGSSAVMSPVTTDKNALKMFIEALTPESVSTQGTNFKVALEQAHETLKRGGTSEEEKVGAAVTQALVIVSDGEDNEPGAVEAAEKLKKLGVRIFTLGFGTEKGAPIPVRDQFGNLKGYRKDSAGKEILSKTKGTILKQLAKEGGGSFYHVTFGSNIIASLQQDILKLEQTTFNSAEMVDYEELFQWFLFLSFIFIFLDFLLTNRKPKARIWKGRFEAGDL